MKALVLIKVFVFVNYRFYFIL